MGPSLPPRARSLVARIETLLEEASTVGLDEASPDVRYNLTAMREQYLPQTLERYEAIPASLRSQANPEGKDAETVLLEQLSVLLRAVERDLGRLTETSRDAQTTQTRFLQERFTDHSSDIAAVDDATAAPAVTGSRARRFAGDLLAAHDGARALVQGAAQSFKATLPQFTRIEYGGLWGTGSAIALHVTVPTPDGNALRYTLDGHTGSVAASCTRIVKNVPIKSVAIPIGDWLESLYEELEAYGERHRDVRTALGALADQRKGSIK